MDHLLTQRLARAREIATYCVERIDLEHLSAKWSPLSCDDIVVMPGEGDLLVMGGACQRNWLHGVPAADTGNPRISLTWRWTSRRGRPDTNPGYFDGRQFSDAPRRPGTRRSPG